MKKQIQPIFVDADKLDQWDESKAEVLRRVGYEIIFIPDAEKALMGLPSVPFILQGDIVTRCLLKAVMSHEFTRNKFGAYMLDEINKSVIDKDVK